MKKIRIYLSMTLFQSNASEMDYEEGPDEGFVYNGVINKYGGDAVSKTDFN